MLSAVNGVLVGARPLLTPCALNATDVIFFWYDEGSSPPEHI